MAKSNLGSVKWPCHLCRCVWLWELATWINVGMWAAYLWGKRSLCVNGMDRISSIVHIYLGIPPSEHVHGSVNPLYWVNVCGGISTCLPTGMHVYTGLATFIQIEFINYLPVTYSWPFGISVNMYVDGSCINNTTSIMLCSHDRWHGLRMIRGKFSLIVNACLCSPSFTLNPPWFHLQITLREKSACEFT